MDMTMFCIFVSEVVFFVCGIMLAIYHYRRVNKWDKTPTTTEYMECLFIGWSAWMLIIIVGGCLLFTLLMI